MKYQFILAFLFMSFVAQGQKLTVYDLTAEHKTNPIGIEEKAPRMSWKINGAGKNILQNAYAIRVATAPDFSAKSLVWESGKINADESILQPYGGPALTSGKRYHWQVKVWDNQKRESAWSPAAYWEMGLLNTADWKAQWIEPTQDTTRGLPARMLRKDFTLNKQVKNARAYVTSHGMYELRLNGKKVGDQVLMPGWTNYNERLQYQVYDVTPLLQQGANAVGAMLGDGWYRGSISNNIYGKVLGLLCQLNITYADGSEETIITDGSWKATMEGPIVMNSIYDGENYDARKELRGWDKPGFNENSWKAVTVAKYPEDVLVPTETVPVKKIQELKPVKIFRTPKGTLVADLGQNMVGWIRLKAKGPAGTTITIKHAEVLDKWGEFYTENLRSAKATMQYTLKGGGTEEVYEPHFTFFGFRYISVEGFPGELRPEHITGVVIHSAMEPTGTFECSNPLVNQLQHNIQWGQKGNFVDVPTDCPQRDERLGWTGDAQAFSRTAAFNMDVAAFFTKWLKDLASEQSANGSVPPVIPNILGEAAAGAAGWADAATIIPIDMYQVYGDRRILETQYESMKAWVEFIKSNSPNNLWNTNWHFGDWLFFRPEDDLDGRAAVTDKHMIAQCFWAHSTSLLIEAAKVLGKTEDVTQYSALLEKIKEAYLKEYVTPSGRLVSGTQTAYVLALNFDMLPEPMRTGAAQRLVENIRDYGNHLTTGFLGTPYLNHVLTRFGHHEVAYTLLLQESYPSWLYPVTKGATTIWERWDGQKPDSTFQNKSMNSFNHYAYGAIGDWMYQVVAGINIEKPGYRQFSIRPIPDSRLSYAKASYQSSYGQIASAWEVKDNNMTMKVTVPPNTTALITLPGAKAESVTESGSSISSKKAGFKNISATDGNVTLEAGSGEYVFVYPLAKK